LVAGERIGYDGDRAVRVIEGGIPDGVSGPPREAVPDLDGLDPGLGAVPGVAFAGAILAVADAVGFAADGKLAALADEGDVKSERMGGADAAARFDAGVAYASPRRAAKRMRRAVLERVFELGCGRAGSECGRIGVGQFRHGDVRA